MERKYDIEQNFEQCMDEFNKKKRVQRFSIKTKDARPQIIAAAN